MCHRALPFLSCDQTDSLAFVRSLNLTAKVYLLPVVATVVVALVVGRFVFLRLTHIEEKLGNGRRNNTTRGIVSPFRSIALPIIMMVLRGLARHTVSFCALRSRCLGLLFGTRLPRRLRHFNVIKKGFHVKSQGIWASTRASCSGVLIPRPSMGSSIKSVPIV